MKHGITWLLITVSSKLADVMSLEDIKGGGFKPVLAPVAGCPPVEEDGATAAPDDVKVGPPPPDNDVPDIPPVAFMDELFVAAKGCSTSVLDLMLL